MTDRHCKIYWSPAEPNEATRYYVGLMEQSLKCYFSSVTYTHNIEDIQKDDVVVIISIMSFLRVWKQNHKQDIIYWWQGIAPEESTFGKLHVSIRDKLKYYYYCGLERLCLHVSRLNFFVSKAMHKHYERKYKYNRNNYIIMPCFNQKLNEEAFSKPNKYKHPSFVYAGSILAWQCVEEALILYGLVKKKYPIASMTLLTRNHIEAQVLVDKHNLTDVEIKFVPLEQLNKELSKYKYGMLLRADDPVNNVATPTKFNSYLAVGGIPILSQVIGDYGSITNNMKFAVCVKNERDFQNAFNKIDILEQNEICPINILDEYKTIFNSYYNEPLYINRIANKLAEIFI